MTPTELLDSAELMQVALQASERHDCGSAIGYLKRLLLLEPDHALALYLLGAQQAQIGLFAHARTSMGRALGLQPGLDLARFQLGWLELNADEPAAAEATWAPLEALGPAHPLVLFKRGLQHFARHELTEAVASLEQGVQAESANAALAEDMRKVLAQVRRQQLHAAQPEEEAGPGAEVEVPAMFLKAYTGQKH